MRKRIGFVVPFDFALDREYWDYASTEASLHITRTPFRAGLVSPELVSAVSDPAVVAEATRSLVKIEPDVVVYACTSGSFSEGLDGERRLRETMLRAGAKAAITTSGALIEALHALDVSRVAVATPYVEAIGRRLVPFLESAGFQPLSLVNMELQDGICDVGDDEVVRLAERALRPGAEALFLSCTNLPTGHLLAPLERRLGIPVLSANQVTMWAALRMVGARAAVEDQILFQRAAPGMSAAVR
jgi:maleate isomerase